MRVFVAGATGVVGVRVLPLLTAAGHEVTAVGRSEEKRAQLQRLGARAVSVDLFDADAVRTAVAAHDVVVNLTTAVPAPTRAFLPGAWREMDRIRRQVSANLAAAALASDTVGRMVQESFAPIYPDSGDEWIDEASPVRPLRYNRSVLDAESNAQRITAAGRTGVVLRFAAFYGPKDPLTLRMLDAVRSGWFPLVGRPEGWFSFVSHDDAASAVVTSLGVPAGVYNVVEHQPMRRRELADGLAQLLGVRPPRFLPTWASRLGGSMGETLSRSLRISSHKLQLLAGWMPRHATMIHGVREFAPTRS